MAKRLSRRITLVIVLAASLNLGWQVYQMDQAAKERQRIYENSGLWICHLGPSTDQWARLYIELGLITAFAGSYLKGFKGLLLTVIGLTGAAIIFILWRSEYFRLVELVGEEIDHVENIGGLMGANVLDIAIVATVAFLILIHFCDALLRFRATSDDL